MRTPLTPQNPENPGDQNEPPVYVTAPIIETSTPTKEQESHLKNLYDKVAALKKEQAITQRNLDQQRTALARITESLTNENPLISNRSVVDVTRVMLLEIDKLAGKIDEFNEQINKVYQQANEYKRSLIKPPPTTTIKTPDTPTNIQKQPTDTSPILPVIRASEVISATKQAQSARSTGKNDADNISHVEQDVITPPSTTIEAPNQHTEIESTASINEQLRINKVITHINSERTIKAQNSKTHEEIMIGNTEFPVTHISKNKNGGYDIKSIKDNVEVIRHLSDKVFTDFLNKQLNLEINKSKADIVKLLSKMSMIQENIDFRESQKDINNLSIVDKIVLARRNFRKINIEMSYRLVDEESVHKGEYEFELKDSQGNTQIKYFNTQELNQFAAQQVAEEIHRLKNELNICKQELLSKSSEQRDLLLMRLREVDQELTVLNTETNNQKTKDKDNFDEILTDHHTEKIINTKLEFERIKSELNKTSKQIDENKGPTGPQYATITKIPQPLNALVEPVMLPHQRQVAIRPHASGNIDGARQSATITRTFNDINLLEAIGMTVKEFTKTPEINRPVSINLSQKEITITSTDQNKEINFKASTTFVSSDNINDKNLQAMSIALVENLKNRLIADQTANDLAIKLGDCQPPYVAKKFANYINIELNKLKITQPDLADRIKDVPVPTIPTISPSRQENATLEPSRSRGPSTSRG